MMQRRDFWATGVTLSAVAAAGTAFAQGNAKIERIVVPFAAGGVQDLPSRALSHKP